MSATLTSADDDTYPQITLLIKKVCRFLDLSVRIWQKQPGLE